jgi:hypothetical protein
MLGRAARGWLAVATVALPGCYKYTALQAAAQPGVQVQIELNDAGRVGMASSVGPEIGRVDGVLESSSDSSLVVRVSQTWGEYGGLTRWDGERVAFRPEYIRTLRERRFSTTRTAILAATVSAGVVAFLATRNLLGFGSESQPPSNGGPPGQQ